MLKHIFRGYRARDTLNNLKKPLYIYWSNIHFFYKIINKDIFQIIL